MSAPICLMLEARTVRVVAREADTSDVIVPWSPSAPDQMVEALRDRLGRPSGIVIAVGLGLLEVARPDLPPLSADARRAVLWRDADRYFPIDEAVAVVTVDALAFAVPARLLTAWVRAIGTLGAVRGVVTAPQLCRQVRASGQYTLDAGDGERGLVEVKEGRLIDARRLPGGATATHPEPTAADATALGRAALAWQDASLDVQLLDASLASSIRRDRRRRWWASAALAAASVLLVAWSADRWRSAQLASLQEQVVALSEQATPALAAESRRARAMSEAALLTEADARQRSPDAPLSVLVHLTRVLPRDAFVQRLEWDGQQWRVDGTSDNAPRLVPLLDGDAHFRDVRIVSASQRFLDAGRQRESFSIGFRMRPVEGGARGTP